MSEHMTIQGETQFHHLPYDFKGGMVFCTRCKKITDKPIIDLDEGYRVKVKCHRCKKTIWFLAPAYQDDADYNEVSNVVFPKDNKKCCECGKGTNDYDCVAMGGSPKNKKLNYWCSSKCYKKEDRK